MAKIFRTEKVNLAGNIRLEASDSGEFEVKNSTGTQTLLSKAGIDSDVSSLEAQDIVHDSDVSSLEAQDVVHNSDVSSLEAQDLVHDSDVSSLEAQDVVHNSDVSSLEAQDLVHDSDVSSLESQDVVHNSDVSSLEAQDVVHDSDVSSLDSAIEEQDVVALKVANGGSAIASGSMASTSESVVINFGRTFSAAPVVLGFLNSTGASDPIIPVMITAVSTTQATASFGDALPSNDYTLEVFASVSG